MVELSEEMRRALSPVSPKVRESLVQAGISEAQQAKIAPAVAAAMRCGGLPPRIARPREGATCTPEVVMYDAPCTDQLALCFMFRVDAFVNHQNRLRQLIANQPSREQHLERATWCYDVLSTVADALDATNVRPEFFNEWGVDERYNAPESKAGPQLFTRVGAFVRNLKEQLRTMGHEITDAIVPPLVPSMGGNTFSDPDSKKPIVVQMASSMPWYVPQAPRVPEGHLYCKGPLVTTLMYDIYGKDRDAQYFSTRGKEYLRYLFVHHPENGIARGHFCHERSMSILDTKEWSPAYLMSGGTFMEYCAAWALDIIATPLGNFIAVGMLEWLRQLMPFYANGMLDIPLEDIKPMIVQASREMAIANVNMMFGTVAAAVVNIPVVGWIAAAIIVVLQGILNLILLGADMAAGWSCPLLPFKRSTVSGECAVTEVETRSDIDRIRNERLVALAMATGIEELAAFRDQPAEGPPPLPPMPPMFETNEEAGAVVPWGTVAIVGGAAIGGALLLRFLRR